MNPLRGIVREIKTSNPEPPNFNDALFRWTRGVEGGICPFLFYLRKNSQRLEK
jgi:hypothetical protein